MTSLRNPGDSVPPLTVTAKLFYGIGEIPITVAMTLFGLFIVFFYGSVMRLPGTLVGIGCAAGLLFDALIDPYIGYRSDRFRSALGRRHPFMLAGAATMGMAFWLLLSPPQHLETPALFLWLLVTIMVFRFASALYRIPYLSLGADLVSDYHERTKIVGIRSVFGLAGTLAAATLSFALFFPVTQAGVDPKLNYFGYTSLGAAGGVVMTLAGLAATLATWQWRHSSGSGLHTALPHTGWFFNGFASAWKNASFRRIWLCFTIFFVGVVLNASISIHYYKWYVSLEDSGVISQIQAAFYIGALIGVLAWVLLARRFEKSTLCLVSIFIAALALAMAKLLFGVSGILGTGRPLPLIVGNLITGAVASALWVLPGAMIADIADQDQLVSGTRREGLFFGILNLGEKIASGGALLIGGVLLEHFIALSPGDVQSPEAVERVGILYGLVPAVLLIGAGVSLRGYRLGRAEVLAIQTRLAGQGNPRDASRAGGESGHPVRTAGQTGRNHEPASP